MKNREIIEKVSQRTNIPEAQIEVIESQLWLGVKHYLSNPLTAKQGILLNTFVTFTPPSVKTIKWYLQEKGDVISEEEREFYNNYLKILEK